MLVFFVGCLAHYDESISQMRTFPEKKEAVRRIFNDIVDAINDKDLPPHLEVRPGKSSGIGYNAGEKVVVIDEEVIDLCYRIGKDSLDALSFLISHELAHYYKGYNNGKRSRKEQEKIRSITREQTDMEDTEGEADYFAGFYGRLAGYDPLRVAARVLENYYSEYKLPDIIEGYPPLGRRKAIASQIHDELKYLVPIFQMANYLGLVGRYSYAQIFYDHVIQRFASREILNNAGVVYTLGALQILDSQSVSYIYPLELDADTRLRGIDRGTRSTSPEDSMAGRRLIDSAEIRFAKAMASDRRYSSAGINLATVYVLKGEYRRAITLADSLMKSDTAMDVQVLATTVASIAYARMGDKNRARKELRRIRKKAEKRGMDEIVRLNLDVLDGKALPAIHSPGYPSVHETINGLRGDDTNAVLTADMSATVGRDTITIFAKNVWNYDVLFTRTPGSWVQFICTEPEFDDRTKKGIRIGSPAGKVREEYGEEPRMVKARQGTYYIYEFSKMIFLIGTDDQVRRWMVYGSG